jgi:hypothetical protein
MIVYTGLRDIETLVASGGVEQSIARARVFRMTDAGVTLDVSALIPNGGGEWGYGGTGPNNLARWLLQDSLGTAGKCPRCDGSGGIAEWNGPLADCEHDEGSRCTYCRGAVTIRGCYVCGGSGESAIVQRFRTLLVSEAIGKLPHGDGSRWLLTQSDIFALIANRQLDELIEDAGVVRTRASLVELEGVVS